MSTTSEFSAALNQVCSEKGLSPEAVLATIEAALVSAYRKDYESGDLEVDDFRAEIDAETGEAKIFKEDKDVTPAGFGRIASQTAKQVLLQRLREAEKDALVEEYKKKIGTIASGHVFRIGKRGAVVDLGRAQAVLPSTEQIPTERYSLNQRLRFLISEIREGERGPEIIISRAKPKFVEALFSLEVPEMSSGVVTVAAIAREAGGRTKLAVVSSDEKVDPVGACVGQKGVRVQAVIEELGDEKIDIIEYSDDPRKFIASALSPAKVTEVTLSEEKKEAKVKTADDQLSLAIGKDGQNVRLAARLTGWRIDIQGAKPSASQGDREQSELEAAGLSKRTTSSLAAAGISSVEDLKAKGLESVKEIKGMGPKAMEEVTPLLDTTSDDAA